MASKPSRCRAKVSGYTDNMKLGKQAEIADKICECLQSQLLNPIYTSEPSTSGMQPQKEDDIQGAPPSLISHLCQRVNTLTKEFAEWNLERSRSRRPYSRTPDNRRPRPRNKSRNRNGQTQGPNICYYHRRFGDKARKCTLPCAKLYTFTSQGNSPASQ